MVLASLSDRFGDARLLWALLVVPALLAAYVLVQRRRPRDVVRFTNLELLESVVERAPRWRRHVPAALFLAAVLAFTLGLARPQATLKVPREEATVVLVIDVSGSMKADDVKPTRLQAAKDSAEAFVRSLPPSLRVGVVAFSTTVRVLASPTADRDQVKVAIDSLQPGGGTAMGDAILAAVGLVRPQAQAAAQGQAPANDGGATNLDPKKLVPATVLLLSDGANTVGEAQPLDAADIAKSLGVPVFTVALGTQGGEALIPDGRGGQRLQPVPPDPETLKAVAERTDAASFDAPSAGALKQIYKDLGSKVGYRDERKDATHIPLAIGLVLLLGAAGLSLLWQQRLP
jgi:Ca-activated chloride channel family protein